MQLSANRKLSIPKVSRFEDRSVSLERRDFREIGSPSLLQSLTLRNRTLVPDEYPKTHRTFMNENGIQHFQVGIEPNKNPFVAISQPCHMFAALGMVLDRSNHPLLIHCNKGKVRLLFGSLVFGVQIPPDVEASTELLARAPFTYLLKVR